MLRLDKTYPMFDEEERIVKFSSEKAVFLHIQSITFLYIYLHFFFKSKFIFLQGNEHTTYQNHNPNVLTNFVLKKVKKRYSVSNDSRK